MVENAQARAVAQARAMRMGGGDPRASVVPMGGVPRMHSGAPPAVGLNAVGPNGSGNVVCPPVKLDPAVEKARRAADLEARLSAKRKFAELECQIERVALEAVERASHRDRLSEAADEAARLADDAERRRRPPCLLYTSPSPRDYAATRMPSSA